MVDAMGASDFLKFYFTVFVLINVSFSLQPISAITLQGTNEIIKQTDEASISA